MSTPDLAAIAAALRTVAGLGDDLLAIDTALTSATERIVAATEALDEIAESAELATDDRVISVPYPNRIGTVLCTYNDRVWVIFDGWTNPQSITPDELWKVTS